jgi:hypothetical protein
LHFISCRIACPRIHRTLSVATVSPMLLRGYMHEGTRAYAYAYAYTHTHTHTHTYTDRDIQTHTDTCKHNHKHKHIRGRTCTNGRIQYTIVCSFRFVSFRFVSLLSSTTTILARVPRTATKHGRAYVCMYNATKQVAFVGMKRKGGGGGICTETGRP